MSTEKMWGPSVEIAWRIDKMRLGGITSTPMQLVGVNPMRMTASAQDRFRVWVKLSAPERGSEQQPIRERYAVALRAMRRFDPDVFVTEVAPFEVMLRSDTYVKIVGREDVMRIRRAASQGWLNDPGAIQLSVGTP